VKSFHALQGILYENFSRENFSRIMSNNSSWLLNMRKKLGLRQEDVAKALHVTTRSIMNWESGKHEPKLSIKQTKALCKLLGVTLDEIPDDYWISEHTDELGDPYFEGGNKLN